jgi:hypothetical protein
VTHPIDDSQRKAAIAVGITYLFAMAASMLTEGYLRPSFIVSGDAAATAQNIAAHTTRFRIGLVVELLTFVSDTTLIAALYVILSPISRPLALYAAFLRIVGVSIGVMMAAQNFDVLRMLSGAEYLGVFNADQLAALARFTMAGHTPLYNVVFVFLGLGSTVFGYLWLKSGYVPKGLAMLGIFSSVLLAFGTLAFFLVPGLQRILFPAYMLPMFLFEVGMGGWLLVKGLR